MVRRYPFTERVDGALQEAQRVARRLQHEQIVSEHVLLGVLTEPSGEIESLLSALGVDPDSIRAAVKRMVRPGNTVEADDQVLPYTPRVHRVLEYAAEEAEALGREAIDLDVLLLALRVEEKGIAALAMADAGVGSNWLRREIVLRHRSTPPA